MSYQVIARKYRPQRFSDVVGQEHVTQTLANAIQQKRIAHAYLFVGPRGTGKTTLARIFAKCLNCTGGPKVDFATDDPRCQEITEGRSLDVLEIDGASNRGIEEIRELRETVKYAPANGRFKIYIIDEVHMLTKEAFNALLKTLEEPPAHVKFMFATTEPEKVLPTILSRCQRFDLRRIPSALIVKQLAWIAKQENVEIEEGALFAIARGAEGGMRDAESTLDQLISFCGGKIVETDVLSMFGLAARTQILRLAHAVLTGQAETALRELDELAKHGKDLGRLLSDLLGHFRNMLLYEISKGDLRLLEISENEASALKEQIALADQDALTRLMDVFTEYESKLRDAASKRILVEVALLKAIQARNAVPIDAVLQKLQALRDGNSKQAGVPPAQPATVPPARLTSTLEASAPAGARLMSNAPSPALVMRETTAAEDTAASPPPSAAAVLTDASPPPDLKNLWTQLIEAVGRASPFTRSYLLEAHPVSLAKNVFTIGFDPEFADHLGLVDNGKTRTIIQTKLRELGCGEVTVKFIKAEAPAEPATPISDEPSPAARILPAAAERAAEPKSTPRSPSSIEDFKKDPLIKQALELFKSTIVEVRA